MSGASATAESARDLRFAIIGAGMSGILSAVRLQEAGLTNFVIYEKGERLGGTWRENTYPGIGCDVPSHLYSYSFEPNPDWSHRFSPGAEIQQYFEEVARKYAVDEFIHCGEEITRCEFRDGRWQLETSTGRHDEADFLIAATGVLHHPSYPDIPGIQDFEGEVFHSARWDHDVPLEGRRIGIIGTGSTAVQITSAVVDRAAKLSLFQRTAQWIMPQENPEYSDEERAEFREKPELMHQLQRDTSKLFREGFSNAVVDAESPQMQLIEDMCRLNLEESVKDPELREKLRPDYRAACKRLVISQDFYEAIQKPNAELVSEGIEGIEAKGVRTRDGRLHELDILVLATGFRVDRFLRPMEVIGRDGIRLDEAWAERPIAYLSISVPGFPNLFMLNGPNGPVGNFSLIEIAELQFDYIMQLIDWVRSGSCKEVDATEAATEQFDAERTEAAKKTVWMTGCRSWYLDDRGIPATWPWKFDRFRDEMSKPQLSHYNLTS
jgi:cation diffusion facilitator CzcD-associated flavoprotein CzcO